MKGHTNNPNGRPKGTPNKVTKDIRRFILNLLETNQAAVKRDLKAVEPKDRLLFYEKLLQYAIPKAQTIKMEIEEMTESQIDNIIVGLIDKINDES